MTRNEFVDQYQRPSQLLWRTEGLRTAADFAALWLTWPRLVPREPGDGHGVLVLPGFSDSSLVFHAGRSHYADLLDAGVKLYERRDALLHAKTAVVDGVWSTVGSSNMDWRSFALNYEINAVILGGRFGAQMEALFDSDVAAAQQVTLQNWHDRGASDRFMEFFSRLFERWL